MLNVFRRNAYDRPVAAAAMIAVGIVFVACCIVSGSLRAERRAAAVQKERPAWGLWWWDKKLVSDSALDYAKEHGITEIYFCTDLFGDATADFISRANKRGMKVYWLSGDPSWVNDWREIEKDIATKVLPFQKAHPSAKFAGIHLDVEPHGLPEFKDDRKGLFLKLIAMTKALREKFPGVRFDYDLPFWAEDEVEFGGATKPVFAHVMDYADRTVFMTYRDTVAGVRETGKAEIEYAARHGKKMLVAVETLSDEAPSVSFKEEGRAAMDKTLKELRERLPDSVGIAIHHANSWMNFK